MANIMNETKRNSLQVVRTLFSTRVPIILIQLVLLLLQLKTTESANNTIALPGCPESCGGKPIPYPFGIGLNCSLSPEFNVHCSSTNYHGIPTPTLRPYLQYLEILNISLSLGQYRVSFPASKQCYNTTEKKENYNSPLMKDRNTPEKQEFYINYLMDYRNTSFRINTEKNKFTVIGCNALAYLNLDYSSNYSVGCLSSCDSLDTLNKYGSCSGIGCCQTAISKESNYFFTRFDTRYDNSEVYNFSRCSYAMVVEAEFNFNTSYVTNDVLEYSKGTGTTMPIVFNWAIGNTTCIIAQKNKSSYACRSDHSVCLNLISAHGGYLCNCSYGYEGNPYLDEGCQDIDECANQNACSKPGKCHNFEGGYRCSCPFGWHSNHNNPNECNLNVAPLIGTAAGIVALLFIGIVIYVLLERRNLSKVKEKYFQQHGGWILLEKIKLDQGFGFTIFTKQQVEQATNNFDSSNILGEGGHGTVYRGTLRDETVAIKRCKIVDERKKKEFGKEMLILSQINHKNIVKILGCCLEVEVPMLVYEFIPNGTLSLVEIMVSGSVI